MSRIGIHTYSKIARYIFESYHGERILFEDFLAANASEILINSGVTLSLDSFIDNLCDSSSHHFTNLVDALLEQILEKGPTSKIEIVYIVPFYYISSTLFGINSINGNHSDIAKKLTQILDLDTNNGVFFQKFCCNFLNDIGVDSLETKHSGDEGIDLFGHIKVNYDNPSIGYLFPNAVNLLAQVKFHKSEIDVSVIRNIIGDSLLYKFSRGNLMSKPIQLMIISHKGFTKNAKDFAKTHGVCLIDSMRILDILLNHPSIDLPSSLTYLEEYYLSAFTQGSNG